MNARRIKSSDPDYAEVYELTRMLCYAHNPHLFCGMAIENGEPTRVWGHDMDIGDIELKAVISILIDEMSDRLEGGPFADFITLETLAALNAPE